MTNRLIDQHWAFVSHASINVVILPGATAVSEGLSRIVDIIVVQTWTLILCNTAHFIDVIKDRS